MKKNLFKKIAIAFLTIAPFISFAQDLCAGATSLTLGGGCIAGNTTGAADNITGAAGCQSGGGVNAHNDLWYTFTSTGTTFSANITASAPFTGNVEFILVSGACGTQTIVNSVCGASPLAVTINGLTAGTTYYAIISKQGSGTDGPFTICNYATTTPTSSCTSNDDCFTAQNITLNAVGAASVCTPGCNTGAAPGLDFVGANCEDMLNPTVWYTFTTGATAASININLTSATMTNPEYTIYSNTSLCIGPYTILNCLEGTGGSATTTSLVVAPNTTYYIAVSDATGDQGNFNLCIAQNADNSACNTNNNLVVSATSMGSPLAGPYKPGEVVSFCYTITDWQQINCNYIGAVVPSFGDCWAASSFNAQGMPVSITTPLNVNGVIQPCPPGPPCAYSACAGTPAGTWNWFPAGVAQYNVAGGSLPVGAAMGAGWYFLSSYNPVTGACTGDPTDPDFTYGDGNFPACGTNTFDYTLCFNLTAGPAGNCGTGLTDCGVSFKTYADGEFGAWNSIGCTADISTVSSATFACCAPPNMTSSNTYTLCSGSAVSLPLTSDIAATYSWIATNNANVTGESTTAQTTNTLNNTLTNTTSSVQVVVYTITPTSTTSCLGVAQTVTVTVYPKPTTTASTTGTLTCTTTTVSLSSTLSGTSYTWTAPAGGSVGSANTQSTSASGAAGTYTLLVQSAAGCTFSTTTAVTQNITPPTPTASNTSTLTCATTTAVLTGGGGGTYVWSGPGITAGGSTSTPTVNAPGNYTVTVTAANGCTAAATTSLTQNITPPTPTASNSTTLSCTTTTAVLTGGGGGTYVWSGPGITAGGSTSTPTVNAPGNYTVTVTAANGCTAAATTSLTQNTTPPTPTASNSTTLSCTTTTAVLTGAGGGTYVWSGPGITAGGSTSTPTVNAPGNYTVTVTAANGCTAAATTSLTQNITPPTPTASNTSTLTCTTTTAVLTGAGGGTYVWSGPGITAGGSTSTPTVNAPGNYTVTVTAANGCTAAATTSLTQNITPPTPTASNTSTLTCTTTTAVLTGAGGGTYVWSGPGITAGGSTSTPTVNAPGNYTVTVTAANGCTAAATTSLTQNITPPTPTASNSTTLSCTTTTAVLTGGGGGTYVWSGPGITAGGSTSTPTVNAPGNYTVTVTAANGCTAAATTSLTQNITPPTPTASNSTTLSCTTTTAVLTGTGGGTYVWSGPGITAGGSTSTPTVNAPGNYTVTVTAANGCTAAATTSLTQNLVVPTVTASANQTLTCAVPTVTLTGSATPSTCTPAWTGGVITGSTTYTATASSANIYTLTVTNPANGCTNSTTTQVFASAGVPSVTTSVTNSLSCSTLTAQLVATTTASPVSYSWTGPGVVGGATAASATVNTGGQYTIVVTNTVSSCSTTLTASVTQNITPPTPTASNTSTLTCTTTTAVLTGAGGGTYVWSGPGITAGGSTSTPTVNAPGNYTVTVTAANGCTAAATTSLTQNITPPTPTASNSTTLSCTTTTAVLTGGGGGTYVWSGPGITAGGSISTPTVNAPGNYTVTVTAANGCTAAATTSLTQNITPPTPTASNTSTLTCTTTTAVLTGAGGGTYVWSGPGITAGGSTSTPTVNAPGNYTVTVTAANGCTAAATTSLTQNIVIPSVTASANQTLTCTTPTVTLTGSATPSTCTPIWTGGVITGSTTYTATATAANVYTLTVTDPASGCTNFATTQIFPSAGAPTATITSSALTIDCNNATQSVTVTSTPNTDVTYTWNTPPSTVSANGDIATFNSSNTYICTVTNTLSNCSTPVQVVITTNTVAPTGLSAGSNQTLSCSAASVTLNGSVSTPTNVVLDWGASVCGTQTTAVTSACAAGVYTLTATDPSNGCVSTSTVEVFPNAGAPAVTITSTALVIDCNNATQSVTVTSTPSADVVYNWNNTPSSASVDSSIAVFNNAGTYICSVTNTLSNCSTPVQVVVTTNTTVPTTTINVSGVLTCSVPSVTLTAASTSTPVTFLWNTGATTQSISLTTAGPCTAIVTDPSNGCTYTATASITQNTVAPTGLIAGPNQTLSCSSSSVTLNGSISTPTNALLDWGASVCGTQTTAVTSACVAGVYTLTATDPANGCVSTSTVEVFPNAGAPTVTITSTALVIDCNNATQSVTVTSTPSADVVYNWNNTPSSASVDSSIAVFNNAGTYICSVTNTLSNCSTPVQVVITTNTTVPTTTINVSGVLTCSVPSATLTAASTSTPVTFLWNTGATTQSISLTTAGPCTAIVTDPSNGCTYTATASITQNTVAPTGLIAGPNQTLSCSSSSVTLNGSISTPTDAILDWGTSVCGTQTTAVTSACAAGVYTLTATDPSNGCVSTSTVEVFPNAGAPTVTITSTALVIDCNNATQSVTVTSTPSINVVYNWNNTPSSASVDSSIAVFNNAGTYICSVTNTLSNCSTPVQVVVTTNTTAPIGVSAGSNQTLTCASTSVALNGSVTTPTNVLLDWGTSVCGTQTAAVTAACVAGVYTLTATDPANGCVATSSVEVFPNAGAPTATISSTALVIDCNNASQSVTVTSTPNTNVTYTWNIAPATLSTDGSIVSFTSPNTYICTVTNTLSNCSTPVQVVVTTNTTVPTAVTTDTTIPCGASSIILDAVSSATNVSYNWTTSGAGIISTPTASSTSVNSAGQYEVTVTDNTNGCSTTSTVNVTSISVTAAFTANPTSGTAPLLVNFTNQTPGVGNVYSWNFADDNNNTSSATNPSHTYNTTGNYIVTLVVTDASGLCSATATISIDVFENASIVVPNVFTPNGDGKNDIFKITTTGMKDLNCDIFNRWGTKVFTIIGVNGFWDGINSNDGTYFFILTATGFDGAEYKQQGYINLFK